MTKLEGIATLLIVVFIFAALFAVEYISTQEKHNLRDTAYHACMKR